MGGGAGPSPGSATEYDAKVLPKRFPLNILAKGIWYMDSSWRFADKSFSKYFQI